MLSLICNVAVAQTKFTVVEKMMQLNQSGKALQAYQLGKENLFELEGEPEFDLQYGMAAVDSDHVSEGIFALERVLMLQPDNRFAQLEIARAYFILEEYERAKVEFQSVLVSEPPPPEDVIKKVNKFLDIIEVQSGRRETSFGFNLDLGGGYDSNILAAPDSDTFFIPLLNGNARVGSGAESDTFKQVRIDATLSHPIRYGTNIFLTALTNYRKNNSGQLDIRSHGVRTGIDHRKDKHRFRVALQANTLDVDGRSFRDSYGVNVSWQYRLTPQSQTTVYGVALEQKYNDQPFRDALYMLGGLAYTYQFNLPYRPVTNVSLSYGKEDADNDNLSGALQNTERDIWSASTSLSLSLTDSITMTGALSYEQSEYAARESLFQVVRNDEQYRASVNLAWEPVKNLKINLDATFFQRESNIPIIEFEREQLSLTMRYSYN